MSNLKVVVLISKMRHLVTRSNHSNNVIDCFLFESVENQNENESMDEREKGKQSK